MLTSFFIEQIYNFSWTSRLDGVFPTESRYSRDDITSGPELRFSMGKWRFPLMMALPAEKWVYRPVTHGGRTDKFLRTWCVPSIMECNVNAEETRYEQSQMQNLRASETLSSLWIVWCESNWNRMLFTVVNARQRRRAELILDRSPRRCSWQLRWLVDFVCTHAGHRKLKTLLKLCLESLSRYCTPLLLYIFASQWHVVAIDKTCRYVNVRPPLTGAHWKMISLDSVSPRVPSKDEIKKKSRKLHSREE